MLPWPAACRVHDVHQWLHRQAQGCHDPQVSKVVAGPQLVELCAQSRQPVKWARPGNALSTIHQQEASRQIWCLATSPMLTCGAACSCCCYCCCRRGLRDMIAFWCERMQLGERASACVASFGVRQGPHGPAQGRAQPRRVVLGLLTVSCAAGRGGPTCPGAAVLAGAGRRRRPPPPRSQCTMPLCVEGGEPSHPANLAHPVHVAASLGAPLGAPCPPAPSTAGFNPLCAMARRTTAAAC